MFLWHCIATDSISAKGEHDTTCKRDKVKAICKMLNRDLCTADGYHILIARTKHRTQRSQYAQFKKCIALPAVILSTKCFQDFKYFAISIVSSLRAESRPRHVPTSEQSFQRPDPPRYKCSHEKKKQFAQQGQQYPTNTAQPANNGDEKQKIKTLQLCQPSIQFACRVVEISP